MRFRVGDIVRGHDRYGITHGSSTLKVAMSVNTIGRMQMY